MQENSYDVVVIGSGLGGLLTAAILSKEGYKVLVLEKNKQIGGCLQSFGFDKKLFEAAVHYIGSLAEGETLHSIYNYLGLMDRLHLKQLDTDCFDQIILNESSYSLAQGHQNFIDQLSEFFPQERNNLMKFIHEMKNVCDHFPLYNMRIGSAEEKSKVTSYGLKEKLNQCIQNETLKQVLTGNNLLYAGDMQTTPFYQYALIENSYIESSWKFSEGSAELAKLLQSLIKENGGEVLRNIEITHLVEKNGKLQYAKSKTGEEYFASHFISNLHPQVTYRMLDSTMIRPATIHRMNALKNTSSSFMLNVSLNDGVFPHRNSNMYIHTSENVALDLAPTYQNQPTSFGIFFNESKSNPGFATSLSILCYQNMEAVLAWQDTFHTTSQRDKRDASYQEYKSRLSEWILNQVEPYLPLLKQSIQALDACSPLTFRDYLNIPEGSLYGIQKNVNRLAESTISTRTKIPNLYFTGQNVNLHGVLGVSITSVLNAADFVGLEYLVDKIKSC